MHGTVERMQLGSGGICGMMASDQIGGARQTGLACTHSQSQGWYRLCGNPQWRARNSLLPDTSPSVRDEFQLTRHVSHPFLPLPLHPFSLTFNRLARLL